MEPLHWLILWEWTRAWKHWNKQWPIRTIGSCDYCHTPELLLANCMENHYGYHGRTCTVCPPVISPQILWAVPAAYNQYNSTSYLAKHGNFYNQDCWTMIKTDFIASPLTGSEVMSGLYCNVKTQVSTLKALKPLLLDLVHSVLSWGVKHVTCLHVDSHALWYCLTMPSLLSMHANCIKPSNLPQLPSLYLTKLSASHTLMWHAEWLLLLL